MKIVNYILNVTSIFTPIYEPEHNHVRRGFMVFMALVYLFLYYSTIHSANPIIALIDHSVLYLIDFIAFSSVVVLIRNMRFKSH